MNKFSEVCSGRYFLVPENQRGFSWGQRQVEDLIKDLELAAGQSHYLGPVIVSRTTTRDFQDRYLTTTAEFLLEDGQQRVTTLFIFANEIRKRLLLIPDAAVEAEELRRLVFLDHNGVRPRLQNEQATLQDYFSFILTGAPARPAARVAAMAALDIVQQTIFGKLDGLDLDQLRLWKARITNQVLFIWVDLASAGVNRYLTFDAINSRGLPLSEFDKIKNFCILVSSIRELGVDVAGEWYRSLTQLEQFGVGSRSEEASFITELYATFHNETLSQQAVHAAFVNRYRRLLSGSDDDLEDELRRFIGLWSLYARSFGFLTGRNRSNHYGTLCTPRAGKWLDRLDNMKLPTITRPVLVAAHIKRVSEEFEQIARACEIYTFRVHAVMRRRKDTNGAAVVELGSEVLTADKDARYVLVKLCEWLTALAPMSSVVKELAKDDAKYSFDPLVRGWAYCYYFLYEYELSVSPLGVQPLLYAGTREDERTTQEHILPQDHRDGSWWQTHWPDRAEADKYKHRLGNLVLTSGNSQLGRKSIVQKIADGAGVYCYTAPNATNSEKRIPTFTTGNEWRAQNILRREIEMLTFAIKRWSIPCVCDAGTFELPLEFRSIQTEQLANHPSGCVDSPDIDEDDMEDHFEN